MKILKSEKCGKMVAVIKKSPCDTFCCGEPMTELTANTTEAAFEKHIPAVTVNGSEVTVKVGEVEHPMLEAHFIQWIVLETKQGYQIKYLKPGEKPEALFCVADGDAAVAAYEYCNLHGLWVKEL